MRLISLEVDGFKSFAEKTVIKFQPGVTGIIGPNGSGKSNVIEAIRWVMGEQSAKSLRGEKMVDVIFNGAKDRAPLNRAVVKLTLDNSDHFLNTPYTEVTVTRKLFRSGESEYLINGQNVRLKDLVNLFIESGIGKESFAVISQGRVSEIFNGKPSDRRKMIEAIAGVGKYKADKETAQKRLTETNNNLNRVNDIIHELKQRLDPLEEQSALAQDYLAQKQKLDQFDRTATVREILGAQEQLKQVRAEKVAAEKLAADYEKRVHAANAMTTQLQQQRQALIKQKDLVQAKVLQLTQGLGELQNSQSLAQVKREQQDRELDRLKKEARAIQEKIEQVNEQLTAVQKTVTDHHKKVNQAEVNLNGLGLKDAQTRQAKLREEVADLREQQVDQLQQLTTLHNQQTFLKQSQSRGQNQADQVQADLTMHQRQLGKLEGELADQKNAVQKQVEHLISAKDAVEALQTELTQVQRKYEQAQKDWYQSLGTLHSQEARVKNYQAMAADYTGYFYGVQNVLRNREQFKGLFGPVSELITVPKQYTQAIETVLGSQLQQLVVDSQQTGKAIITYLTRTRSGRVTILPLDTLRGGFVPPVYQTVANHPGVLGRAMELIQFAPKFEVVMSHLLATTVVVDNLDHATEVARQSRHQLRIVTLAGEMINASGAMTGGKAKQQKVGLLTQKERQQEFEVAVDAAKEASQKAEVMVHTLQTKRQTIQSQGNQAVENVQNIQLALENDRNQLNAIQNRVTTLKRQIEALKLQTNQRDTEHNKFESEYRSTQVAAEKLEDQLAQTKQIIADKEALINKLANESADQAENRHHFEQALAVEKERLSQAKREAKTTEARMVAYQEQLVAIKQQIEKQTTDLTRVKPASQTEITTAKQELKIQQAVVTKIDQQLDVLEGKLGDATAENERLQNLMRIAYDDLTRINEHRLKLETQIDQGQNHLQEQYQETLTAAQAQVIDIPEEELHRQVKLLKRGLDELGEVNVASINEYQAVKERYDFLTGQRADLQDAETQLKQTMDQMDREVKERFNKTFTELSTAFETTFKQVFAGGQAKLILTDPHDLLETGVDIYAQPPGKKNQQLSLLSGGEKALTALALLFAILKIHPVPFAILDEPEAALDDVNVDRFATYLDRFGDQGPQFIVITHRKGTMVNADVLYGVTMQESGVSKVITVNVDETLRTAQTK